MLVFLLYAILSLTQTVSAQSHNSFVLNKDAKALLQSLSIPQKRTYTRYELNLLVKKIATKDRFRSVRLFQNKNSISIRVTNPKEKSKVTITGNQAIPTDQIRKIINPQNRNNINQYDIENSLSQLKEQYRKIGLLNVSFSISDNIDGTTHLLTLSINEGNASKLIDISVLSTSSSLNKYIKSQVMKYKNRMLNQELIDELELSVEEILHTHRFLGAKITSISPIYNKDRTQAKLTINLENSSSYEFVFYGNRHFSYADILNHLDVDDNYLNFIKNRQLLSKYIKNLYKQNGFPQIKIDLQEINIPKINKTILKFTIQEGPQITVNSLRVIGKISQSPSVYESKIFEFLQQSKNSNFFIRNNLDESINRTISYLKNNGYLKAELISTDYKINKRNKVDIVVQINEGLRTQIRSIRFSGLNNFTPNQVYDVIKLRPNSPLNLDKVLDSYRKMTQFYHRSGYLDFKILTKKENLIKYLSSYELADLTYELKEGPQVIIKDIQTRGNKKTKSKVILRELDLEPGQVLTSETINDSIIYLERTQLFSKAQINTSDVNTDISERSVFIDVAEKKPGLFSTGLGISNENQQLTYRGFLGLSYKNIAGTGRGISGRVDVQYPEQLEYLENRIVIGYYEPYLFFNRLRFRTSILHEEDIIDPSVGEEDLRILENNQLNLSLEKQINARTKLTWKALELSVIKTFAKNNLSDRTSLHIAKVGPIIEYDRRDNPFSPRDGSYSIAKLDYSAPFLGSTIDGSNYIHFYKASLGHTLYSPLTKSKRWVWVNSVKGGHLQNLSNLERSGVPATETFFFGTRPTIRGYNIADGERIPYRDQIMNNCDINDDQSCLLERFRVHTDSQFFLIKSELRFPLYDKISGLVFYDGGAIFIDEGRQVEDDGTVAITQINIDDHYRDSAGFGIRYETPIGAFTAELGFKLDRKGEIPGIREAEDAFNFHISMGIF